jgi:hypothetical protein
VGCCHDTPNRGRRTSPRRPRRLRARICLRKGCGRKYQPRCWNQRYCQESECKRLVRRWQASRRQARRRQQESAKAEHAAAERARRRRVPSSSQVPKPSGVAAARGHAAKIFSPFPLCDRPGCHEVPQKSGRSQRRYCGSACRQAVQRVLDRERKWQVRGTFRGQRAREREYQAARARRRQQPHNSARPTAPRSAPS